MKLKVLHNEGATCAVVYIDSLVITVSHDSTGYELLVEVDGDDYAANVPVSIGNAAGDSVEWDL